MKKLLACLLLVACCAAAWANKIELYKHLDDCIKEHAISEQDLRDFFKGQLTPALVKDNLKCALHCLLKKADYMDDAGKLDIEAVKSKIGDDEDNKKLMESVEKCNTQSGATPCETAFMLFVCVMENGVKVQKN